MGEKPVRVAASRPSSVSIDLTDPNFAAARMAFSGAINWRRYTGARYSLAAFSKADAVHCLVCRIVLEAERPSRDWDFGQENGPLLLRRGWLSITQVRKALEELRSDRVVVDGIELALQRTQPPSQYSWWQNPRLDPGVEGLPWATSQLRGLGSTIFDVLGTDTYFALERALTSGKRPFSTWATLWQFLGEQPPGHGRVASCEFFAPVFARIGETRRGLRDGRVRVSVDFKPRHVKRKELRLVFEADAPDIKPFIVPGDKWKIEANGTGTAELTVRPSIRQLTVVLSVRGESIDRRTLSIPSIAARVHAAVDPGASWLRGLLGGTVKKKIASDGFEAGVAALLSLAGVPTVHYGFKSGDHFPDIIAFGGSNIMIVGECTIDAPNETKVRTLHARAERIRAEAATLDEQPMLARVLFTPQSEASISEDIDRVAKELSVGLGTRERLEELFEVAIRGEDGFTIWSTILGWCGSSVKF